MDIIVRNLVTEKMTVFHKVDSQIAAVLIACGLASEYVKPAPAPPELTETQWVVARLPQSGKLVITCRRPGGEVVSFQGAPAAYKKSGLLYCDSACPESVIEEYARQHGTPEVAGYIG